MKIMLWGMFIYLHVYILVYPTFWFIGFSNLKKKKIPYGKTWAEVGILMTFSLLTEAEYVKFTQVL